MRDVLPHLIAGASDWLSSVVMVERLESQLTILEQVQVASSFEAQSYLFIGSSRHFNNSLEEVSYDAPDQFSGHARHHGKRHKR